MSHPHELGQNFLVDPAVIGDIVRAVSGTRGPIVEIGPGDGALTIPLSRTGRALIAVEVDPGRARRLQRRLGRRVTVVNADFLRYPLPRQPHTIVGNVPFHITTATMRRLLAHPGWQDAVLLVQWEVARRRAGVGGASLMTASWWPWFDFRLRCRVPRAAFRPVPAIDGGVLAITRRPRPLATDRRGYQGFVKRVFTGPGRGLGAILAKTTRLPAATRDAWFREQGLPRHALPRDLDAHHWASLWDLVSGD